MNLFRVVSDLKENVNRDGGSQATWSFQNGNFANGISGKLDAAGEQVRGIDGGGKEGRSPSGLRDSVSRACA